MREKREEGYCCSPLAIVVGRSLQKRRDGNKLSIEVNETLDLNLFNGINNRDFSMKERILSFTTSECRLEEVLINKSSNVSFK